VSALYRSLHIYPVTPTLSKIPSDSSQMYFTLFGRRRGTKIYSSTRVTRNERSRHKGRRQLFLLGSRAWHVILISYRRAGCVDDMIEFTVCYHSDPCAHILTVSLSLTSRSQSYNPYRRMTTWFCCDTGRVTIYGDEDVLEIEQNISLANVLVILPV